MTGEAAVLASAFTTALEPGQGSRRHRPAHRARQTRLKGIDPLDEKTNGAPASDLVVPQVTLNPDAPDGFQALLRAATPRDLAKSPEDVAVWSALFEHEITMAPLGKETGVAALAWLLVWSAPGTSDAFAPFQWWSLGIGGGIVTLWSTFIVWARRHERNRLRQLQNAHAYYVLDTDLDKDAGQLLARAARAASSVLGSAVHKQNLIDRQRNEMALPQQKWEIAETLREYTRLVKAEPKTAEGENVTALLDTRRKALRTSLDGIARRVTALETYAAQVAEADRQYRELQQIQHLTEGSSDVLDLLARTVRDDLAVAEIEGMTGEAAVVASAFTTTLASAKEAAVIALPTARKTA